jgi:hypothetical protein
MNDQARSGQTALRALRELWNEWDPVGVVSGPEDDEYDSYLVPTLQMLDSGATQNELTCYLEDLVGNHMGMGEEGISHSKPSTFSALLLSWHSARKELRNEP